jgi:hypothetical protein
MKAIGIVALVHQFLSPEAPISILGRFKNIPDRVPKTRSASKVVFVVRVEK